MTIEEKKAFVEDYNAGKITRPAELVEHSHPADQNTPCKDCITIAGVEKAQKGKYTIQEGDNKDTRYDPLAGIASIPVSGAKTKRAGQDR